MPCGNAARYKMLGVDEAFRNADSYAHFAYEVIGRPDFDVSSNRSS